ncbi:CMRF35-like molecule 7 [Sinocyclocheilus anshuiensis]|uniref:CMRF35-like molecule 7 n=1 Tax=Sinocyclocheilus anshuiensis TaxID=1608454 RepID=UPI0007B94929|nr:PREDICTED: CMRF35-like molecule 7 [Sinocyclocheilus anshuiensis]
MKFICALWLWMLLSELNSTTGNISSQGHSEGSITITCSHGWASTKIKYFCRDPRKDSKDILVKSDQSPRRRYTLKDSGEGTFTVNITDLQESDSGIYWCGVERFGFDTFTKVKLTVSKGFVKASGPAGEKAGAEHRNSSSSSHIFPVPLYYIPYTAAGLAVMVIICAVGLVTVCQCRKRVKKSKCVIARSIYNSHHSEEANAVYQNAPDDRPYTTIKKSSTKSKDESQSDPIYQNLHFNTTQGETIYGNL